MKPILSSVLVSSLACLLYAQPGVCENQLFKIIRSDSAESKELQENHQVLSRIRNKKHTKEQLEDLMLLWRAAQLNEPFKSLREKLIENYIVPREVIDSFYIVIRNGSRIPIDNNRFLIANPNLRIQEIHLNATVEAENSTLNARIIEFQRQCQLSPKTKDRLVSQFYYYVQKLQNSLSYYKSQFNTAYEAQLDLDRNKNNEIELNTTKVEKDFTAAKKRVRGSDFAWQKAELEKRRLKLIRLIGDQTAVDQVTNRLTSRLSDLTP